MSTSTIPMPVRSKGWLVVAALLALQLHWTITDRWALSLNFSWFLPLLAGWLAGRGASGIWMSLFWLSPLAVFGVSLQPRPEFSLGLGYGPDVYLLSVAAAVAFARPGFRPPPAEYLCSWWRPAVIAGLVLLSCAAFAQAVFTARFGAASGDDPGVRRIGLLAGGTLELRGELAVWLGLLTMVGVVRWRDVWTRGVSALRSLPGGFGRAAAVGVGMLLVLALVVSVHYHRPYDSRGLNWSLNAGLGYSGLLVPVIGFLLAVNRVMGAGRLGALTVTVFLAGWGCSHAGELLKTALGQTARAGAGEATGSSPNWELLAHSLAAVALGVVLAPFWLRQEVSALRQGRAPLLLGVVLAAEFVLVPAAFEGQTALAGSAQWLLGGVAFAAGLVWRGRALWVVPSLMQLAVVQALVGFGSEYVVERGSGSDLVALALTVFPFAFFGRLANRYEQEPRPTGPPTGHEVGAMADGVGWMTVDASPLARVVRRLDMSSTLKAFAVTFTPLLILHNLVGVYRGTGLMLRDEFEFASRPAIVAAFMSIALMLAFAPLFFLVVDWVIRKDSWRVLSALTGAMWGALGFVLTGIGLGLPEMGLEGLERLPLVGAMAVPMIGLTVWLLARARWLRLTLQVTAGLTLLAGGCWLVRALAVRFAEARNGTGEEAWREPAELTVVLIAAMVVSWWLVRAVRLRIILSGNRPRALLLGALPARAFWARVAFLVGLPSSLWHRRALRTIPFWLFVASRGVVFVGFQVLFSDAYAGYGGLRWAASGSGRWIAGGILVVAGHAAFLLGKRLAAREAWVPADRGDARPPVLFLRSFEDDQFRFARPWWDLIGRWFDLWSFRRNADETLIDECAQYGPVVALGRPGERQAPFGARRHYARHEDWQTLVTETARAARAIVICAGTSPGVLWEYELLARERLLDRTLLLFRPERTASAANEQALAAFQRAAGLEPSVSEEIAGALVAWLASRGQPTVVRAGKPGAAAYLLALRAHFQGRPGQELADRALD